MYFKMPNKEELTYHALNGGLVSQQEIQQMANNNELEVFVENMVASFLVANAHAEDMYHLLNTGQCQLGLKHTIIYRVLNPVRVDDVEDKKHFRLVANLEYIDKTSIDTKA